MSPAVIIMPLLLLALVMTLMIGSILWPYTQLGTAECQEVIDRETATAKLQAIISWWSDRLGDASDRYNFKNTLAYMLGQRIFIDGDYPWHLSSRGLFSGTVRHALRLAWLDEKALPAGLKMRITPSYVDAIDAAEVIVTQGGALVTRNAAVTRIWEAPKPEPQTPAEEAQPV